MSSGTPRQRKQHRPPTSPEAHRELMGSLAMDLAEQQLRDGTASAQVIMHFAKDVSERSRLEEQRLREENTLLRAKVEQIGSGQRTEELLTRAIQAFTSYQGHDPEDYDPYDENVY